MLICYHSLTGNVQRFVDKLDMRNVKIHDGLIVDEPFVIVTYTTGFGEVPKCISSFLDNNHKYLKAVATSGNRNWFSMFGRAGDIISESYNVPLMMKFELFGNEEDVKLFKQEVLKFEGK